MKIDPNTSLGIIYQQYEEILAENALKLTQILDLEIILYETGDTLSDESPCWCIGDDDAFEPYEHEDYCARARQATEHLWKK